jgi:asparagine synthetase B (glutamine-hydrolysing)
MLERTKHPSVVCHLGAEEVPELAEDVARAEDEPRGGIPTLANARLFERVHDEGVKILLDGQGMDEQWAGYDYYLRLDKEQAPAPGRRRPFGPHPRRVPHSGAAIAGRNTAGPCPVWDSYGTRNIGTSLVESGAVDLASSPEDLKRLIREALSSPERRRMERANLLGAYVR